MTSTRVMIGALAVMALAAADAGAVRFQPAGRKPDAQASVAVSGVGGMVALAVSQRTREIGLRRTLGARAWDIAMLVMRRELAAVTLGLACGVLLMSAAADPLRAFLFDVEPADAATIGAMCGLFALASLVGCGAPVRRALRVDPNEVLRQE